jgi:hypothetical protein
LPPRRARLEVLRCFTPPELLGNKVSRCAPGRPAHGVAPDLHADQARLFRHNMRLGKHQLGPVLSIGYPLLAR